VVHYAGRPTGLTNDRLLILSQGHELTNTAPGLTTTAGYKGRPIGLLAWLNYDKENMREYLQEVRMLERRGRKTRPEGVRVIKCLRVYNDKKSRV